jgi:hypothetical protein
VVLFKLDIGAGVCMALLCFVKVVLGPMELIFFFFLHYVNDVTDIETASCILHSQLVPYPVSFQFQQQIQRLDLFIVDDSSSLTLAKCMVSVPGH